VGTPAHPTLQHCHFHTQTHAHQHPITSSNESSCCTKLCTSARSESLHPLQLEAHAVPLHAMVSPRSTVMFCRKCRRKSLQRLLWNACEHSGTKKQRAIYAMRSLKQDSLIPQQLQPQQNRVQVFPREMAWYALPLSSIQETCVRMCTSGASCHFLRQTPCPSTSACSGPQRSTCKS
jgi:hypothetical protein